MLQPRCGYTALGLLMFVAGCDVFNDSPPAMEAKTPSVVVLWNEAALAAVRNGPPRPTVISRSLHILHTAMYDAWAAYDGAANGTQFGGDLRRPVHERTDANKRAAISYAAYRALLDQFPAHEQRTGAFTRLLEDLGYTVDDTIDPTTAAGIGNLAAQAVLDYRQEDGANESNNYAAIEVAMYPEPYTPWNEADPASAWAPGGAHFDPNHWQPLRVPNGRLVDERGNPMIDHDDPATYTEQAFLTPHWGAVVPFALTRGDQFRPPAPPKAGSDAPYTDGRGQTMSNDQAYHQQLDEVLQMSAALTDRQKVIAEYWADGPRSETPPGHWHALAHGISQRDGHGVDEDAKLYFALSAAIFDAGIACWDAKRVHDCIRPVSAIRHAYYGQEIMAWGGPDDGTVAINGEDWLPYQALTFVTPPFAEYTSGHSSFSAAAAEVLTRFTGSNRFYDDGATVLYGEDFDKDGVPDLLGQHVVAIGGNMFEHSPSQVIILQWPTFQDASDEAGISRRYGGIHFQDGDLRGRTAGRQIGRQAFELAQEYWTGRR